LVAILATVAFAAVINTYVYHQNSTFTTGSSAAYFNNTFIANDSASGFSWGYIEAGSTYSVPLSINNTGSVPINITFAVTQSPDWTETWMGTNPTTVLNLLPNTWANGSLVLTVSVTATSVVLPDIQLSVT